MKLKTLRSRLATLNTCQATPLSAGTDRLRGRAAVSRRARFLEQHPLCVECEKEDRVTASTVPDHGIPLWAGGPDDLEANGRSLCAAHHDAKSKCEARMRAAGGWLSTACICGQHQG